MGHQVRGQHIGRRHIELLGDVVQQRPRPRADAPDRVDMALRIQGERSPVLGEVDGELGDPQQRLVKAHQPVRDAARGARITHRQPSAQSEVAIEPGVQPRPAIGL